MFPWEKGIEAMDDKIKVMRARIEGLEKENKQLKDMKDQHKLQRIIDEKQEDILKLLDENQKLRSIQEVHYDYSSDKSEVLLEIRVNEDLFRKLVLHAMR